MSENEIVSKASPAEIFLAKKIRSAMLHLPPNWDRPKRLRLVVDPRVLKTRDAAHYLGVSPWTLRNFVRDGLLTYLPGKHWRFSKEDLDDFIKRNREKEPVL